MRVAIRSRSPPGASTGHGVWVDIHDDAVERRRDTHALERGGGTSREPLGEVREDSGSGLDEHYPRGAWVDGPEVAPQRIPGDLGDLAGHLHTGRAAAHHHEGQPGTPQLRVAFELRRLERAQDPGPDRQGIFHRLEAGRQRPPLLVAEIGMFGTRRHHQRVVLDRRVPDQHAPALEIEARHLTEHHASVALALKDAAQRRGDLPGRQRTGSDLVEQRLEQVEIAAIDQRDLDRRAAQTSHRPQATEAPTDHHNPMWVSGPVHDARMSPRRRPSDRVLVGFCDGHASGDAHVSLLGLGGRHAGGARRVRVRRQ